MLYYYSNSQQKNCLNAISFCLVYYLTIFPPNHMILFTIDLILVEDPILTPKPIWQYLGFYFNHKLNFYYHFYATKCLSTLNIMKLLGNSS